MLTLCHELQDHIVSHVHSRKDLMALSTTCSVIRQHALRHLFKTLHISQFKWDTLQPVIDVRSVLMQTGYFHIKTVSLIRIRMEGEILILLSELRQATTLILHMVYMPRYPNILMDPLSFTVIQLYEGGWGDYTLPFLFNNCPAVRMLHGSGSSTVRNVDITFTTSDAVVSSCNQSTTGQTHHRYDNCNLYDLELQTRYEYDLTDVSIFLHNMSVTVDPISRRMYASGCFDRRLISTQVNSKLQCTYPCCPSSWM